MSDPTYVIGRIVEVVGPLTSEPDGRSSESPPFQRAFLRLEGGRTFEVPLDTTQRRTWFQTLSTVQRLNDLVALEIAADERVISVGLATTTQVLDIVRVDDDAVSVSFNRDNSLFLLRQSSARDRQLLERLRSSVDADFAIVVEDLTGTLLAVESLGKPARPRAAEIPPEREVLKSVSKVPREALDPFFAGLKRDACDPDAIEGCFPIPYPDNYCWAVASEVGHRLASLHITSAKVWLLGHLGIKTVNHPCCRKSWGWHVAALVRIANHSGDDRFVIDPSLSTTDVIPFETWRKDVSGKEERPVFTPRQIYVFLGRDNFVIEVPGDSDDDLERMREKLRLRAAGPVGPPPYPRCRLT